MNQGFNYSFDRMREGNPTKPADDPEGNGIGEAGDADYPSGSNTRNVCFVLPDGNRIFLNYGYLVAGEFHPEDGEIILSFTSHVIKLKGVRLESLFYDFMSHLPKQIVCKDDRYNALDNSSVVNALEVTAIK